MSVVRHGDTMPEDDDPLRDPFYESNHNSPSPGQRRKKKKARPLLQQGDLTQHHGVILMTVWKCPRDDRTLSKIAKKMGSKVSSLQYHWDRLIESGFMEHRVGMAYPKPVDLTQKGIDVVAQLDLRTITNTDRGVADGPTHPMEITDRAHDIIYFIKLTRLPPHTKMVTVFQFHDKLHWRRYYGRVDGVTVHITTHADGSPGKLMIYLPSIYADTADEALRIAHDRAFTVAHILADTLRFGFDGPAGDPVLSLRRQSHAMVGDATARQMRKRKLTYRSPILEVDSSHGRDEMEFPHPVESNEHFFRYMTFVEQVATARVDPLADRDTLARVEGLMERQAELILTHLEQQHGLDPGGKPRPPAPPDPDDYMVM